MALWRTEDAASFPQLSDGPLDDGYKPAQPSRSTPEKQTQRNSVLRRLRRQIAASRQGQDQKLPLPARYSEEQHHSDDEGYMRPRQRMAASYVPEQPSFSPGSVPGAGLHAGYMSSSSSSCSSSPGALQQAQAQKRPSSAVSVVHELQVQYKQAKHSYMRMRQHAAAAFAHAPSRLKLARGNGGGRGYTPSHQHSSQDAQAGSSSGQQLQQQAEQWLLHDQEQQQDAVSQLQQDLPQLGTGLIPQTSLEQQQLQQHVQQAIADPDVPSLPALTVVVKMLLQLAAAQGSLAVANQLRQQLLQQVKIAAAAARQAQQPFSVAAAVQQALPGLRASVMQACCLAQPAAAAAAATAAAAADVEEDTAPPAMAGTAAAAAAPLPPPLAVQRQMRVQAPTSSALAATGAPAAAGPVWDNMDECVSVLAATGGGADAEPSAAAAVENALLEAACEAQLGSLRLSPHSSREQQQQQQAVQAGGPATAGPETAVAAAGVAGSADLSVHQSIEQLMQSELAHALSEQLIANWHQT